jgi:hypothetical protein
MKTLEGKTIEKIEFPDEYTTESGSIYVDDNIKFTFTDGTVLELASWDCERYSSGIYKKINGKDL